MSAIRLSVKDEARLLDVAKREGLDRYAAEALPHLNAENLRAATLAKAVVWLLDRHGGKRA